MEGPNCRRYAVDRGRTAQPTTGERDCLQASNPPEARKKPVAKTRFEPAGQGKRRALPPGRNDLKKRRRRCQPEFPLFARKPDVPGKEAPCGRAPGLWEKRHEWGD